MSGKAENEGPTFRNCYFRPTDLHNTELMNCHFLSCEFEHLGLLESSATIRNCTLSRDTHVHSITRVHETEPIDLYDPSEIATALTRAGFSLEQTELRAEVRAELDQDLRIAEKALHAFTRSTVVSEGTFQLRLSVHASRFTDFILPKLLRAGVLENAKNSDRGQKYKLGISLSHIADALADCGGSFNSFLQLTNREKK
jgi:hypothetical protein